MTNRTYNIVKDLFKGDESISSVSSSAYYRYIQARVRIQFTVELGVTWRDRTLKSFEQMRV